MRQTTLLVLGLALVAGCKREVPPPPPSPPPAVAPLRGAAGDADLRVMVSELAASRACGMIRGGFKGLRPPDGSDIASGVLWVRGCEVTNLGTHLTFHITGNGWSWVEQTKAKTGAKFTVHQYIRFTIEATIVGSVDIAYDRAAHVVSLWFTPDRAPDIDFKTLGDIDVDRDSVWSSVVGGIGTMFMTSPEHVAVGQAESEGTKGLDEKLAQGIAVTLNLCTGLQRVHFGRPPKGDMGPPGVGETRSEPVEIKPGGVMIIGPQGAEDGMTLEAEALQGAARLTLVCAKDAETVAAEFLAGRVTSHVPMLGTVDVRTKSKLRIKPAKCGVVVVASPLGNEAARFAWVRPSSEIARSTGGSLVDCRAEAKTKAEAKKKPETNTKKKPETNTKAPAKP